MKIVTPGDYSALRAALTEAGAGCSALSFERDGDGGGSGGTDTIGKSSKGGKSAEATATAEGRVVLDAFGTHDGGVDRGLSHDEQCGYQAIIFVPSHDRWSTGLKHALLCGSVVL